MAPVFGRRVGGVAAYRQIKPFNAIATSMATNGIQRVGAGHQRVRAIVAGNRARIVRRRFGRREREPIAAGGMVTGALPSSPSTPDKSWPVNQMISCGSQCNTDSNGEPS